MLSFYSMTRPGVQDSIARAVSYYEAHGDSPSFSLEQCCQAGSQDHSSSVIAALVKIDMQRRFELGQRPRAAEYLDRFPILIQSSDRVVSLVYEEFCLLQECGANPDSAEFCEVYAPWRDSLFSQLVYHRELSQVVGSEIPSVKFPLPGDRFDKYRLESLLGKGGVAQVYLATEDGLGGRKVAIKVSASLGQEPSILANLDHRNIVPILTDARSEAGLLGICMPYRPGLTLEELIRRIGRGSPPSSARAIWDALKPSQPLEELPAEDLRTGWVDFPIEQSFFEAVAWIGLALTNALSYMHGEGVLHRDIKPANVLLAYREGPQLLDFNLAQDPRAPEHVNSALKGGTIPYMAPEQLRAFLDPEGWSNVKAPADLYSLGLVLKELVTGQAPEVPSGGSSIPRGLQRFIDQRVANQTSIRQINPSVPGTLISIIEKCLSVEPSQRYENALALAEDLRHFLSRKPLQHAPNTSKVERTVNFVYRNPSRILTGLGLVGISLIFGWIFATSNSIQYQVQRHEGLLDSNRPEDLVLARENFSKLYQSYPNSAWPPLYLGLTLQKLGNDYTTQTQDLIAQAGTAYDAEEAFRGRLRKDPNSVDLLLNLGILLKHRKNYLSARAVLLQALGIHEDHFQALCVLGDIERKLQNSAQALKHLARAARVAKDNPDEPPINLYRLHTGLLPLYAIVSDRLIDQQSHAENRTELGQSLKGLQTSLDEASRYWTITNLPADQETHQFLVEFFEGCLASNLAVLDAQGSKMSEATQQFDRAERCFSKATQTISNPIANAEAYRTLLLDQKQKLKARRLRYPVFKTSTSRFEQLKRSRPILRSGTPTWALLI